MPAAMPDPNASTQVDPTSILVDLILAFLAPIFLTVTGGNITHARLAAARTLESYRTRTDCDLILVAQIIAFGLAALGTLSLSMTDGLSLPMILRLRGSAQGSSRAAERNRRALKENDLINASNEPSSPDPAPSDPGLDEAQVIAAVAAATERAAEVRAEFAQPAPQWAPVPRAQDARTQDPRTQDPRTQDPRTQDARIQALWAEAFTDVANEIAIEIPNLPPAQRKIATIRAAALSSSAHELLSGSVPPRLRPGDRG
jgi:hypothetical protein